MKRFKNAGFSPSALQHIYHRAKDKGVIFYTLEDRLVYYTLAATKTKAAGAVIYAASIMFTHVHLNGTFPSLRHMERCLRSTDTAFARLYNFRYGREGQLFDREPGSAQKSYSKQKRTSVIYVFNNHVEKGLCTQAEQERWSLLAYAFSCHPFSEQVNPKTMSTHLAKAFRLVDRRVAKNKALEYVDLDKILPALDRCEREQFVDYVISRYALVDYGAVVSLFGSAEKLRTAVNSSTGNEFEIKEEYPGVKDTAYVELCRAGRQEGWLDRIHTMAVDEKFKLTMRLRYVSGATDILLKKFFHLRTDR